MFSCTTKLLNSIFQMQKHINKCSWQIHLITRTTHWRKNERHNSKKKKCSINISKDLNGRTCRWYPLRYATRYRRFVRILNTEISPYIIIWRRDVDSIVKNKNCWCQRRINMQKLLSPGENAFLTPEWCAIIIGSFCFLQLKGMLSCYSSPVEVTRKRHNSVLKVTIEVIGTLYIFLQKRFFLHYNTLFWC